MALLTRADVVGLIEAGPFENEAAASGNETLYGLPGRGARGEAIVRDPLFDVERRAVFPSVRIGRHCAGTAQGRG